MAVDGISQDVRRGEVFGVLGPNGAGKTTTVECAAGLRRPDGGTVRVLGLDPLADPAVRLRVGVQLQHAVLPNRMNVREAMRIFASTSPRHADPDALLAEWELAEQHGTVFAALSGTLAGQEDLDVIGEAENGRVALDVVARELPDVVLMDLDAPREVLFRAVRAAARGEPVLAPGLTAKLLGRLRAPQPESLTDREVEVLGLVAKGLTNRATGRELAISEATVKTHLVHAFTKLGVDDHTAAVTVALERGLLRLNRR
ncbi:LuxR C-terminal-related transcriptional regulator [Allokutzneria albata]|uniref:ABC transporter n=1 Tax=Allokutzneria albata TaxID=211114 RepID=A0A1G9UJJ4_ALLAB|nr:LuxR C-terminal-related transcriptional regulator [Allokutzneria albata]SDM59715.1 ABC transporter [Allokutzneria albata]